MDIFGDVRKMRSLRVGYLKPFPFFKDLRKKKKVVLELPFSQVGTSQVRIQNFEKGGTPGKPLWYIVLVKILCIYHIRTSACLLKVCDFTTELYNIMLEVDETTVLLKGLHFPRKKETLRFTYKFDLDNIYITIFKMLT